MPGFAGLAAPAAQLWRAAFLAQTIRWLPRYTTALPATFGLGGGATDPHATGGVARCPVCFNAGLQRPASTACTTCWGSGWIGGYAAERTLQGMLRSGSYQFTLQPSGELMAVSGVWLHNDPADGIVLPQDLILATSGGVAVRYLVGEMAQFLGLGETIYGRVAQLEALAPDSPLQRVPA